MTPDEHEDWSAPAPGADDHTAQAQRGGEPAAATTPAPGWLRTTARLRAGVAERARQGTRAVTQRLDISPRTRQADDGMPLEGQVVSPTVVAAEQAAVVAAVAADQASVVSRISPDRSATRAAVEQSAIVVSRAGEAAATVARSAARQAGWAARGTLNGIVAFFTGIGYFWVAAARFARSPSLWLIAAIPVVLLGLLLVGLETGAGMVTEAVIGWITGFTATWPSWINTGISLTVEFTMGRVADIVIGFVLLPASIVIGAPFYLLLVRRVDRQSGRLPERVSWLRAIGFALVQTVRITLIATFGWVLVLPFALIPALNVAVAPAVVLLLNGFLLGVVVLALPLRHRGVRGFGGHLRYAWRHLAIVTGYGMMSLLVLALPVTPLRLLTIPIVMVGAVLLVHRIERAPSGQGGVAVDDRRPVEVLTSPPQV